MPNSMLKPDISFIMPSFKDGDTLEVAVNSLLDQDWKNLEVIVVNDGTDDSGKTNKILDKFEKQSKKSMLKDKRKVKEKVYE